MPSGRAATPGAELHLTCILTLRILVLVGATRRFLSISRIRQSIPLAYRWASNTTRCHTDSTGAPPRALPPLLFRGDRWPGSVRPRSEHLVAADSLRSPLNSISIGGASHPVRCRTIRTMIFEEVLKRLRDFRAALAISCFVLVSCNGSPTEPTQPQATAGLVAIAVSQPCSLPGTLEFSLQGGPFSQVAVPGETRISVPAGHYAFSFRRGSEIFGRSGSAGYLAVTAGGTTTLNDPPEACTASASGK